MDALAYARAVSAVANHLDFVIEDLTENDLSEDEEYVKLSEDDLVLMSSLTESSEEPSKYWRKHVVSTFKTIDVHEFLLFFNYILNSLYPV